MCTVMVIVLHTENLRNRVRILSGIRGKTGCGRVLYSRAIAALGHSSTQMPQPLQCS